MTWSSKYPTISQGLFVTENEVNTQCVNNSSVRSSINKSSNSASRPSGCGQKWSRLSSGSIFWSAREAKPPRCCWSNSSWLESRWSVSLPGWVGTKWLRLTAGTALFFHLPRVASPAKRNLSGYPLHSRPLLMHLWQTGFVRSHLRHFSRHVIQAGPGDRQSCIFPVYVAQTSRGHILSHWVTRMLEKKVYFLTQSTCNDGGERGMCQWQNEGRGWNHVTIFIASLTGFQICIASKMIIQVHFSFPTMLRTQISRLGNQPDCSFTTTVL